MKIHFPVKIEILARFVDVDIMGHVNNACYLSYFEQARVAYYKKLGALDLRKMDKNSKTGFIVSEIGIKYHAPAFFDEVLTVATRIAEMRTKAFRMDYEIQGKKDRRLIATGYSVQVMYNYRKGKTFEIPPAIRKKILNLERKSLGEKDVTKSPAGKKSG